MDRMDELLKIRTFLESKYSDFPNSYCAEAADLVARVLKYPVKTGYFYQSCSKIKNFSDMIDSCCVHAWNYDPTRSAIIDLARNSLGDKKSKIFIIPKKSQEAKRYFPSWIVYINLLYYRKTDKVYKENFAEFLNKA